jgi:hypothetical protein
MRLFYDITGRVTDSIDAATDGIEQAFIVEGAVGETKPDRELYLRLVDPKDKLHPHDLIVTNPKKPKQK